MLVKLPRNCSGREIIEAFKIASTFEDIDKKWKPEEFVDKIVYEPGSVRQVIRDMGVRAHSFSLRKKWDLFGKKIWKLNNDLTFTLDSLDLYYLYYKEVNVEIKYIYDLTGSICTGPGNSNFEDIRPIFERILSNFYARLQPQ